MTFTEILQKAGLIKNETVEENNSATRIGQMYIDVINFFNDLGNVLNNSFSTAISAETSARNTAISAEVTARNLAITTAIDNLKNGVPQAFDTLMEIYNELQNDDSVIAGLINTIAGKVDRIVLISITGTIISSTAGQKAYDPSTKKIYTSTANHTWGIGSNPSTGIIYTYNGSNYIWKQTDLIEIGTGGTGGGTDTGMLTVEANSLPDFDDIFAVGVYEIVGDYISGFYIGSFIFPKLKQMVIWDNKIYTREMDDITGTFTFPNFKDYNDPALFTGKVDKVSLLARTDNMDQAKFHNIGDKWFDLMSKKIYTAIWSTTINNTKIWDDGVVPSNGVIYLSSSSNYVWNGVDLIEINKPDLRNMIEYQPMPFTIGQVIGSTIVAYILQPTDVDYDSNIQKGLFLHNFTESARDWTWDAAMALAQNEWSLPTKAELLSIYPNKDVVGLYGQYSYWTSDQADGNEAYAVDMTTGQAVIHLKGSPFRIRSVSKFKNYIGGVNEGDITVYSDETGTKIRGTGKNFSDLMFKSDFEPIYKDIILLKEEWDENLQQIILIDGVTETNRVFLLPNDGRNNYLELAACQIGAVPPQVVGQLTFAASVLPDIDLTLTVKIEK